MKKITFNNKQNAKLEPLIPIEQKLRAEDVNEIKDVINSNVDEIVRDYQVKNIVGGSGINVNNVAGTFSITSTGAGGGGVSQQDFDTFKNEANRKISTLENTTNLLENGAAMKNGENTFTAVQNFSANINLSNHQIKNVGNPVDNTDAVSMNWVKDGYGNNSWLRIVNHTSAINPTAALTWTSPNIPTTGQFELFVEVVYNSMKFQTNFLVNKTNAEEANTGNVLTIWKTSRAADTGYPTGNPPYPTIRLACGTMKRASSQKFYMRCLDGVPADFGNLSSIKVWIRTIRTTVLA